MIMLLVALVLVLAALGLLVVALTTSAMLWAWASVGASVLAAVVLVVDWARRRRAARAPVVPASKRAAEPPEPGPSGAEPSGAVGAPVAAAPDPVSDRDDPDGDYGELDLDTEPAEEDTDAADLLAVTDLDIPVVVVDERPRYHLASCRWLGARPTLALPVREARELGFTPCAVCGPDRALAAAQRGAGTASAG